MTGPIDTDAQLDWTAPAVKGTYTLRYEVVADQGTFTDDVVVEVVDLPTGPQTITPDPVLSRAVVGEPTVTVDMPPGWVPTRWGVNTVWGSMVWGAGPPAAPQAITIVPQPIPSRAIVGSPTVTVAPVPLPITIVPEPVLSRARIGAPSLTQGEAPPDEPITDLTVSLFAITPDGPVALPDFAGEFSPVRNSAGSVSVDYPPDGENFHVLRDAITSGRDVEFEVWPSGTATQARRGYLQEASGDDTAESGTWTFAGGFLGLRMDEAVVLPQDPGPLVPDDDADPTNDKHANEKRELIFNAATPGTVMATAMTLAHEHGWLTDITWDFTATADSDGNPWPQVMSTRFSPGATYTQLLDRLNALGLAEWDVVWDGAHRVLRMWVPEGRGSDLTLLDPPPVLRMGQNILDAPRKWSVRDAGTDVLVAGTEGLYDEASDPTAVARRGRRIARYVSASNLADADAVTAYAINQLQVITAGLHEITHGIGFLPGTPRPIATFDVGDWILSQSGDEQPTRYRVVQWTLKVDADGGLSGTVTLNDTATDALSKLLARLDAITTGDTVVGTSTPSSGSLSDITPPAAPEGLTAESKAYQDPAHTQTLASVTVGWQPVVFNADGSNYPQVQAARYVIQKMTAEQANPPRPDDKDAKPLRPDWTWEECPRIVTDYAAIPRAAWVAAGSPGASGGADFTARIAWLQSYVDGFSATPTATDDVAGYQVRYAYVGLSQVGGLPSSDPFPDTDRFYYEATPTEGTRDTSFTFGGVEGGATIRIEVRAFDRSGNYGPWATIGHDTSADDLAPPQLSAPTLAVWFRTIDISWDGTGALGEPMPVDFDHVEVWISQSLDFSTAATTASIAAPFNPLDVNPQHVANLNAAGTWNQPDIPHGVGWFAALRAVDRSGNASPFSTVAGPVTAEQLFSDDLRNSIINDPDMIARETIGTAHIVDGAIVRAKIGALAVGDANIETLNVGKLRSGTMIAQVTISGKFRTHESDLANRVEFDAAGLRLYRGTIVVGDWNVETGDVLITGTYRSALSGERINIFPDGTFRFYPQAGTNYSQMSNVGSDVVWRGPIAPDGRSGRVNVNALGVGLNYSAESEIPDRLRSEVVVFDRRVHLTAPFQSFTVDGRYENPFGGRRRIQFQQYSSSGTVMPYCFVQYGVSNASGRGGFFGNGAGWKFEAGSMLVTDESMDGFGAIKASSFVVASTRAAKRNVVDVDDPAVPLDAEQVFRDVPAVSFNYLDDAPAAPARFGVIAEELPDALQYLAPDGKGGIELSIDLASQLGVHHAAIRRIIARLDALEDPSLGRKVRT